MQLLTVYETAEMLRVAPVTVRRYIADGRLAAVKAGRGVRVRRESVDEFVRPVEPKSESDKPGSVSSKVTTAEDALWNIIGIAHSTGPGNVSKLTDDYLAEAYYPKN